MGCNACTKITKAAEFVIAERECRLTVVNPEKEKTKRVKVDCCTIPDGENCDYFIEANYSPKKKLVYVELKGRSCDFSKALSQIKSTWEITKEFYDGYKMKAFVVGSIAPKNDATFTRLKKKFQKETQGMIVDKLSHNDRIDLSKI
jgi:hypothetical protein